MGMENTNPTTEMTNDELAALAAEINRIIDAGRAPEPTEEDLAWLN